MKSISILKRCAVAILLAGFMGTAIAEDRTPSEAQLKASAMEALRIATLAGIANDRYGTIAGIVAVWEANLGAGELWQTEFSAALNSASDAQLLDIQNATSYDAVRAILQGRDAPATLEGVTGTEALGSLTSDLVFTPVVPCRFFDTRNDSDTGSIGHTGGSTATIRSYQVYGDAATMLAQGGTVACLAPNGEPVGISANFTAAPLVSPSTGKGNIRAYPSGGSLPDVSLVNYEAGTNIANAAIVATCYLCGFDLDVATRFHSSASIGDVMGYFYPADELGDLVEMKQGGYDTQQIIDSNASLVDTTSYVNHFQGAQGGNTTLSLDGGESVMVMASMMIHKEDISTSNNIEGEVRACYENTAVPNTITQGSLFQSETDFCFTSTGEAQQHSVQVSGLFTNMPAGTYRFGFCAKKGNSNSCFADEVDYRVGGHKINVIKVRQ